MGLVLVKLPSGTIASLYSGSDACFARCVSTALWPIVSTADATKAVTRLSGYEQVKDGVVFSSFAEAQELDGIEISAIWNKEDECLSVCAWRSDKDSGERVIAGAQWLKRDRSLIFSCGAEMAKRYDLIHKCAALAVSCDAEAHFEIYEEHESPF